MENSKTKSKAKSKPISKGNKSATSSRKVSPESVSAGRHLPGEDEIRSKAQEIYNQRVSNGESGSAEDDWLKAERILRG